MSIDYSNLKNMMKEKSISQKQLASLIGISEGQLCKKLNGEYVFKQTEIIKICETLNIDAIDISKYFFTEKVEKSQLTKGCLQT